MSVPHTHTTHSLTQRGAASYAGIAGGALALAAAGGYAWITASRQPLFEMHIFDAPGGPTAIIRTADDARIVIDGGADQDVVRRTTSVMPFYSRRIDMIVSTVPEGRRSTGLIDLVDRYDVGEVVIPDARGAADGPASTSDRIYEGFLSAAASKGTPIVRVRQGDTISLGGTANAAVLFPAPAGEFEYSKASGPRIVMRIEYGSTSIMFAGSATKKIQTSIAAGPVASDALVIYSNPTDANLSRAFMDAVRPKVIVYSALAKKRTASGSAGSPLSDARKAGLLAGILPDDRFNIRERGEIVLVSDGSSVSVR